MLVAEEGGSGFAGTTVPRTQGSKGVAIMDGPTAQMALYLLLRIPES